MASWGVLLKDERGRSGPSDATTTWRFWQPRPYQSGGMPPPDMPYGAQY